MNDGKKRQLFLCLVSIAACSLLLMVFLREDGGREQKAAAAMAAAEEEPSGYFCTRLDEDTAWDGALEVDLAQVDGDYRITEAGSYLLYGEYEGQICIDAEEQLIHLILKDVRIHSGSGSAVYVKSAGKVVITRMDGTTSILQDNAHYRGREDGDAVIYSACDLTVNGPGSLEIYGFYDCGIHSRDVVKVLDGALFIRAKGNGIQGNDGLYLSPAVLSIESEQNGLYSKKSDSEKKGAIDICGGEISIIAGAYGISSSQDLYVRDCSLWSNGVLGPFSVQGEEYLMGECLENEQVSP